jgi:hypothetical protein
LSCATKESSIHLTKNMSAVKEGQQKYCETVYSSSGINHMWILKNSKDLLDNLKSRSFSQVSSIKTFDFSTLYTTSFWRNSDSYEYKNKSARRGAQFVPIGMPTTCWKCPSKGDKYVIDEETTDTASSASFLDLYLEFDDNGQLSTKIYDKWDDFNFKIINFPNMCSNIPASPAYGVYISQLHIRRRKCQKYFYVTHWQKKYPWHFSWLLYLYTFSIYENASLIIFSAETEYMVFTSRNWFAMQGPVAIILISWNVIFIWETGDAFSYSENV